MTDDRDSWYSTKNGNLVTKVKKVRLTPLLLILLTQDGDLRRMSKV